MRGSDLHDLWNNDGCRSTIDHNLGNQVLDRLVTWVGVMSKVVGSAETLVQQARLVRKVLTSAVTLHEVGCLLRYLQEKDRRNQR